MAWNLNIGETSAQSLNKQMDAFVFNSTMTAEDKLKSDEAISILKDILRSTYPECDFYPCGSYLTGTCDSNSDVDIYVDLKGVNRSRELANTADFLAFLKVKGILSDSRRALLNVGSVSSAKIPIIRAVHIQTGVKMDLSFNNILGRRKSELILLYINWFPETRHLILIVQQWAKRNCIVGQKKFKTYALVLLVLVFLMYKQKIPTVAYLQQFCRHNRLVDECWTKGFSTFFKRDSSKGSNILNTNEILGLAEDFFNFFGIFDYRQNVICTVLGGFKPRVGFCRIHESKPYKVLPYFGMSYEFLIRQSDPISPLVIEDPFDLGSNVGHFVTSFDLDHFKKLCLKTAVVVKNIRHGTSGKVMDIFIPINF